MAKHSHDHKTADLLPADIAPIPKRRGRPPKGDRPMTQAERKRSSRAQSNMRSYEIDQHLVASVMSLCPGKTLNDAIAELCALKRAHKP